MSLAMFEQFHFLRPLWLLALIPAALFFLLMLGLRSKDSSWSRAIDPALLPFLLEKHRIPGQNRPLYGMFLIWALAITGMAGPTWEEIPVPVQEREDALVMVLDLSFSMLANDLSPNRMTRAQRKVMDVLSMRKQEGQTALVVYAGDSHAVTPLTDDVETIRNMVPVLAPDIMPVMGSNPASGIRLAVDLLANSALPQAQILLITDGINRSDIPLIRDALAGTRHTLSILGIGTEEGSPIPTGGGTFLRDQNNAIVIPRLERRLLEELASVTRARYSDATLDDTDVTYLLDQSIFDESDGLLQTEQNFDSWHDVGPWLVLLILPFAALAFRRGWLMGLVFVVGLTPPPAAMAFEWRDLWVRKDRQAAQVFEREDYDSAANIFQDDAWRAAANYRRGNYEQVLQDLALLDDPESHYNRGNALAHLNRLEEAILAYEQTLAQVPDHADALHNKAIVEDMLQQQQEEEQQQQQDQSGENEDEQQQGDEEQDQEEQDSDQQQDGEQQQEQQEQDQQEQSDQEQDEEQQEESSQDDSDPEQQEQQDTSDSDQQDEEDQSTQQFLQRIADDPGELLRNKFRYQSRQRLLQQLQNPDLSNQQPEQIW